MVESSGPNNPSVSSPERTRRFPPGEDFTSKIEPFLEDELYRLCSEAIVNPDLDSGQTRT